MTILDTIIANKRVELATARKRLPEERLIEKALKSPAPGDFAAALRSTSARAHELTSTRLRVIAEIKRASPSAGVIRADCDPLGIAMGYEAAGAAALSILTDEKFFQGALEHVEIVHEVVNLPILRKDFTLAAYHVYEARWVGADAVLLIVAVLEQRLLADLVTLAGEIGLAALVEVHDPEEADRALAAGAKVLGINNRDLRTFQTDLAQTEKVLRHLPAREGLTIVSESGIRTADDLRRLADLGVDAALIGEHLMRADDPGKALAALLEEFRA
jgi:indole-3-glycerol phosphate synthase